MTNDEVKAIAFAAAIRTSDACKNASGHRAIRRYDNGFWSAADWIFCRDGKRRPAEPGTFPLAHGVSRRVDKLRSYGNAIVPQVAEAFIRAYLESGIS
jgi:hypothetical protein